MENKNPIIEVLNNGWGDDLPNYSKLTINHLAKQMIPDLHAIAHNIQLETNTDYTTEELVNMGYISLVYLITAGNKLNFDRDELLAYTSSFLNDLVVEETKLTEHEPLLECDSQDCLGKECPSKICNSIIPKDITEEKNDDNYDFFNKKEFKQKTKIFIFEFYQKKQLN